MSGHVGAGIIILGIAAFLFIMGIKGTQHQLFPQIFGTQPQQGTPGVVQSPVPGQNVSVPDKNGHCASGYNVGGYCVQLPFGV